LRAFSRSRIYPSRGAEEKISHNRKDDDFEEEQNKISSKEKEISKKVLMNGRINRIRGDSVDGYL
jgi:hypothetical protein